MSHSPNKEPCKFGVRVTKVVVFEMHSLKPRGLMECHHCSSSNIENVVGDQVVWLLLIYFFETCSLLRELNQNIYCSNSQTCKPCKFKPF